MIVSEARLAANRRNAQRSTGPKTLEGKQASRANALKHGLCASVVVPEDATTHRERHADIFNALKPNNHYHCWLVGEVAVLTLRVERAERMERRIRDKIAIRAETSWEDDKKLEAIVLGERLGDRPAAVVEQLKKTPQGCEWLMARWALLAHAADANGKWSPEQTKLAFDLMATPEEFRFGLAPGSSIDFDGRLVEANGSLGDLARREVAALKERRAAVEGLDEANRAMAMADLADDTDPELKRLRRYESSIWGKLRFSLAEIRRPEPSREVSRWLRETWVGPDEPAVEPPAETPPLPEVDPLPEPSPIVEVQVEEPPDVVPTPKSIHPPFDLEPHEFPAEGEEADIPKILNARRQEAIRRAHARRDAKRRKAERLRA